MSKPISAQTIWSVFAGLAAVVVAGGMVYMLLVVSAVQPIDPKPQQFAINAITELTRDKDKTGSEKYLSNVFVKTNKTRLLPAPYQGGTSVPYNRDVEFGKTDLSSDN